MTLSPAARSLLEEARRATLATIADDGHPRLVPICYVVVDHVLWSPLDEKPKATDDPRALARVRDILARPEVAILVDRWSEDWTELAWLRISGRATLVEGGDVPPAVIAALRAKHRQYRDHDLGNRPALRIEVAATTEWSAVG